jgi:hypothetical protein
MLGALTRYFQRRKLAFVVVVVPALLKARYGGQAAYAAQQVRQTIERLKVERGLSPFAFAALL